jgi:hypothetical protein
MVVGGHVLLLDALKRPYNIYQAAAATIGV